MQASQTDQVWFVGVVVAQGIIDVLGGPAAHANAFAAPVYSLPAHAPTRSLSRLSPPAEIFEFRAARRASGINASGVGA